MLSQLVVRKLNEVSLSLQGTLITLIDYKRVIRAFVEKFNLFRYIRIKDTV